MQITGGAHCVALSSTHGNTSNKIFSLPNIGTSPLESGVHSASELGSHGAQPRNTNTNVQYEQSETPPPSYQEFMCGRFVEITPGQHGLVFDVWQNSFLCHTFDFLSPTGPKRCCVFRLNNTFQSMWRYLIVCTHSFSTMYCEATCKAKTPIALGCFSQVHIVDTGSLFPWHSLFAHKDVTFQFPV